MKQFIRVALVLLSLSILAQNPNTPKILSMQERAEVIDTWLAERVTTVLPQIMR